MRRALILGGTGLIGRAAARRLSEYVERPDLSVLARIAAQPTPVSGLPATRAMTVHSARPGHRSPESWFADHVIAGLEGVDHRTTAAGLHPWRRGFVLDTSAALGLGYRPVGDYAATVPEALQDLV
ncbi:hypothetical protein JNUCC0626_49070 [Lentzea sp. JNUCC 0626]|uniref:hypothetical protein n=1 Tax=Lentzea sp. JNUCC 0626 TaxID=3367513 RepID=UPI00374A48D8